MAWLLIALNVCCAVQTAAEVECREDTGQLRDCSILFVHSYHPGLEWVQILSENFATELSSSTHIRIDTEFLDAKRHPTLDHAETFLKILREKYGPHRPDVLVISDDPAFDLLWPIREELFPGVPIVFMGLNSVREELNAGASGITGIFELHTTHQTVELALELTGAEGIIVLNDTSETGKANEVMLGELVVAHPQINWVIERDLSVEDIDQLASLPDDWPIITMLPLREESYGGPMLSQRESAELLRRTLPNPLFYDSEWMMGSGLVGGYSLSGTDHARQAGALVLKILGGAAPEDLPLRYDAKHQWIFDQRELDRFGWTRDRLPEDAVFQFVDEGFWERHQEIVYPVLGVLTAAALIILILSATVNRQRRAEARLREQEQRLSAALAATDAGVFEIWPEGHYASPRWLELTSTEVNQTPKSRHEDWMKGVTTASRRMFGAALDRLAGESHRERIELTFNEAHPRILDVLMTSRAYQSSKRGAIIGVATDITMTRHLEEEAARRNRLEMLGELAGGIAHDFNNFLLVVKFSAEMAKKLDSADEMRQLVVDIEESGLRATDMVKQLLTFGRNDPQSGKVIDLNQAIHDTLPFLQRMIGLQHDIVIALNDEHMGVRIDRPQLERVLSNLIVNARDAMEDGGKVYLETQIRTTDSGESVVVTVRDEGEGMDAATCARIFEPFYSTKTVDKGTGLGLSTVYGIVSGSNGVISVESEPGTGTTFLILWPRESFVDNDIAKNTIEPVNFGEKTILLIEDDPHVRAITRELLDLAGSKTIIAEDGREGLRLFSERPNAFDLVLSDVVLPKMNGIEMVAEIRRMRPSTRVAFMSGYTDHPSLGGARLPLDVELLRKPFTREEFRSFVERQFEYRDSG